MNISDLRPRFDAGKTAAPLAGEVKARGERGISVSSAVMSFEHEGLASNLLDTPGHQDFSPIAFRGPPTAP